MLWSERLTASLPFLISYLVNFWGSNDFKLDRLNALSKSEKRIEIYDYIIVGGGSAGSVISRRLAEDGRFSVLLLEAGGNPLLNTEIPMLCNANLHQPHNDWMYKSIPQKNSAWGFKNNQVLMTRGKMLGGSSGLNFMMHVRGNKEDFNRWADITKDPSWNYENILKYFKKSENYFGNYPSDEYHGTDGPLVVSHCDFDPGLLAWLKAGQELGFNIGDYNGENQTVFSPIDLTTNGGSRESTWRAFHEEFPNPFNKKLTVKRYSHVTKINIDKESMKAHSVNYFQHDLHKKAFARREIILFAGAINTPQLLMLSGIGPKEHLEQLGIEVKVDLPVGQNNFQDHVGTLIGPFMKSPALNPNEIVKTSYEYLISGKGPLGNPSGVGGVAFIKTPNSTENWNNIELIQSSIHVFETLPREMATLFGGKDGLFEKWLDPYKGQDARFVIVMGSHPKSRGTIKLSSKDPFDPPEIDPNYFSHPQDIQDIYEGIQFTLKLFEETEAFKTKLGSNPFPTCSDGEKYPFRSREYFECFIRSITMTVWHYSGTCPMGFGQDDPQAVVTSDLKVIGTKGLRVVDGSVFPKITNGNLNAPIIMVAEKSADLILNS